jgi:glycosyltransferase involved in cell wall biosynthesis
VTCHDLLAVRGALGEQTDCPASFTGRWLQMSIMRGLRRADALACVSNATLRDAHRLLPEYGGEVVLAPNALSYPYQPLDQETSRVRLASIVALDEYRPFVLSVGSNLRRKNREAVLRSIAAAAPAWNGSIVFAGQPLTAELHALASELKIADRVVEVVKPSNETLEALYNRALALLFPSRFEGFGWPVLEAQACGCPVICSDRAPLPEVAGGAALFCGADDVEGQADAILTLSHSAEMCADLRRRGQVNAARFSRAAMIERFGSLYRRLAAA